MASRKKTIAKPSTPPSRGRKQTSSAGSTSRPSKRGSPTPTADSEDEEASAIEDGKILDYITGKPVRYVPASTTPRLAIVVSDDRTVDVIPVLRPRIRRSAIEERIAKLQASNVDDHYEPINWLDKHRYYLDRSQCDRVNTEQRRLDAVPRGVGEVRILRADFRPDPECTAEYFEPEGGA